jgi:hypothetical protein
VGIRGLPVGIIVVLLAVGCGGDLSGNLSEHAGTTPTGPARECDTATDDTLGRMNDATFAVIGEVRPAGPDGEPGSPVYALIGTAWAVGDRLLATNAHVTEAYKEFANQGVQLSQAIAVQSRTGSVVRLLEAVTHPAYTGDPLGSPDIGLFVTDVDLPVTLPLAGSPDVRLGDEILIVGFPADVNEFIEIVPGVTVPQATSLSGRVTALRSHDLTQVVTTDSLDVIQHQAPTSPGTSGSAMIACDEVIAVNNAGTVQLVVTPGGGDLQIDRTPAASNNFGVHVRHLRDLLGMRDAGGVASFALPVPAAAIPAGPSPDTPVALLPGTWLGGVIGGPAEHRIAFAIEENGDMFGLSEWEGTGQFDLTGTLNPDGTFRMVDNAPERLGFRRGIYEGVLDMAGNVIGVYFEETMEQQRHEFQAQKTR